MFKQHKAGFFILFLTMTFLISGCGLFEGEQALTEIDPPKDVSLTEEGEALNEDGTLKETDSEVAKKDKETVAQVERVLYLIDSNGFVVPQTMKLPETKEVAKQALDYLVMNGPVQDMLPNGFRAVLPAETTIKGVNLQEDGTIIADFSNEFKNYKAEDEEKILQALTYTLTQFENVDRVKIRINGHDLHEMPVNGTPITDGVSRGNGINVDSSDVVDITGSQAVTLYFLAQNGDNTYYVPVTKRVEVSGSEDLYTAAVNELIKGPSYTSGLLSEISNEAKLLKAPEYKDGIVTLDFNEGILENSQGKAISDHVINSLVLSLTEQKGVEGVSITVNGKAEVVKESGEKLTKPVSRPAQVNITRF